MNTHSAHTKEYKNAISKQVYSAFTALSINSLLNQYTLENIVLGFIQPNEKIPINTYLSDLDLLNQYQFINRKSIVGRFIDENEQVIYPEKDKLLLEFFIYQIENIFAKAMINKYADDENYVIPCNMKLHNYLLSLFKLFKTIMNTEHDYSNIPTNTNNLLDNENQIKISKFIVAIKLNGLRIGYCVNRYLNDIKEMPDFVKNLIKKDRHRIILTKDADSIEYKIAIFSIFKFLNLKHKNIFDYKIWKWYILLT